MKIKYHVITIFFSIGLIFLVFPLCSYGKSQKMHPRNKMLMQMPNDTDQPYKWPRVPRVTALEAYNLYTTGKALLVNIGEDSPKLMNGLSFTEKKAWKLDVRKLHKYAGKRIIIVY